MEQVGSAPDAAALPMSSLFGGAPGLPGAPGLSQGAPGLDRPPVPPIPPEGDDEEVPADFTQADNAAGVAPREQPYTAHLPGCICAFCTWMPKARDKDEEEARAARSAAGKEFIERGLRSGRLIKGSLIVSMGRPNMAIVKPVGTAKNDRGSDLVIIGRQSRNRAVNGDIVIVELVGDEDAEVAKEEAEEEAENPLVANCDSDDEEIVLPGAIMDSGPAAKVEKSSAEGRRGEQNRARVVAIAEAKGSGRVIICTLHPTRPKSAEVEGVGEREVLESDKFVKAIPTDSRMPWILLQVNKTTRGVLRIPGQLNKNDMWPLQIGIWSDKSRLPLGRLKGSRLGQAGDLEAEVKHCLIENELDDHDVDFHDDQLDEVDDIVMHAKRNFQAEALRREDLRAKRIFTIDPATAKDLDDAIHVDIVDQNTVEVGVHIADVGHFMKLGTLTDKEAQRRSTSVYLVDRVLPMLPFPLCSDLCSLNPNEPKLSFSVYFRLDQNTGELLPSEDRPDQPKPWFKKSVMSSCCRLNYEEVQDVLDGREIERPNMYGGHSWDNIVSDIFLLFKVCGHVRTGRMTGGALSITKTKMVFHTRESDDGIPTNYHLESHSASHWIIEELMLLANRCVAQHLAESKLSTFAVLRNHTGPDPDKLEKLEGVIRDNLNLPWLGRSAGDLYTMCQKMHKDYGPIVGECIEMMTMRSGMKQAEYFVYGPDACAHHFALNFDYYTHFTSPIRRYPDVMVHRVLAALLGLTDEHHDSETAVEQCEVCNDKKSKSRKAQESLDRAVFCVFLRARSQWFYGHGIVLGLHEDSRKVDTVTVYIPQLGREKKVCLCSRDGLEALKLYTKGVDDELLLPDTWSFRGRGAVTLKYSGNDVKLQVLSCVPVVVIPTDTVPIDFAIFFVSPLHSRYNAVHQTIPPDSLRGFEWKDSEEDGVTVVHAAAGFSVGGN